MGNFDPYDWESLYFGAVDRPEAVDILNDLEEGTFFVRDSASMTGEYVLSVKEPQRVCHYLITRLEPDSPAGQPRYKIGENNFPDVASLLNFYKSHYLESTHLVAIAQRKVEEYQAAYDFKGEEASDLSFAKGDRVWVLRREAGSSWWQARDEEGRVGAVPSTYLRPVEAAHSMPSNSDTCDSSPSPLSSRPNSDASAADRSSGGPLSDHDSANANAAAAAAQRRPLPALPAWATCIRNRNPNAYDPTQLRLTKGARIRVESRDLNGTCYGSIIENGAERKGNFPFTHIAFDEQSQPLSPNNNT